MEKSSVSRRNTVAKRQDKNHKSSSSKEKMNDTRKWIEYSLCSYHELPDYMKDNQYILNYYRANFPIKEALFSIFRWHNETLNVWTHLVGFFVFVGILLAHLVNVPQVTDFITMIHGQFSSSEDANISKEFSQAQVKSIIQMDANYLDVPTTNWPFYTFLCGVVLCLISSTICHLFSCHSHKLNTHLLNLDFIGITTVTVASSYPVIYYIFQCTPHWQKTYFTTTTLMGLFTIFVLTSSALQNTKRRLLLVVVFFLLTLCCLLPQIHAVMLYRNDPHRNITMAYEAIMALTFATGTLLYACRIPERWKPGWFDLVGHSHQLFHVCVLIGFMAQYGATHVVWEYDGRKVCDQTLD